MGAAEHASRILTAWMEGDSDRIEVELNGALRSTRTGVSRPPVEHEEQELLESVASHLRRSGISKQVTEGDRLATDFALLRHLSGRSAASV